MKIPHWLLPKLGLRRWFFLAVLGAAFIILGIIAIIGKGILQYLETGLLYILVTYLGLAGQKVGGIVLITGGVFLLFIGFRKMVRASIGLTFRVHDKGSTQNIYQRHFLKRGPRIVVIGGGTGLSVLLRGIKQFTSNITAIVSVTDDGGSSGRLRGQFGILPPGDLRNCLVALADTEPAMEKLFSYRFTEGEELAGHNLGNLFITAMAEMTGSFETALNEMGKVLAVRGKVVPSTYDNLVLGAELEDGTTVIGESLISKTKKHIRKVFLIPQICQPAPEAIEAIMEADVIVLGPGSLYTSVIPNLLVPGMVDALKKSKAVKIYACNVMTQAGETGNYTASDHLKALHRHSAKGLVDYIITNNKKVPQSYLERYAKEGAKAVEVDQERIAKMHVKLVQAPLIEENDYIRHNSQKLASIILQLILEEKAVNFSTRFIEKHLMVNRKTIQNQQEEV